MSFGDRYPRSSLGPKASSRVPYISKTLSSFEKLKIS